MLFILIGPDGFLEDWKSLGRVNKLQERSIGSPERLKVRAR
jgi:hypothetical protein